MYVKADEESKHIYLYMLFGESQLNQKVCRGHQSDMDESFVTRQSLSAET